MARSSPLVLAAVAAVALADVPQQFHVAVAGNDGMRISFKTNATAASTQCSYGLSAGNMNQTAFGSAVSYLDGYGSHHTVLLKGLPAASTVFYACGDGTPSGTSPVQTLTTVPAHSSTSAVRLAILGDWGYLDSVQRPMDVSAGGLQKNWSATLNRELLANLQAQKAIDGVWLVGDIGYADDSFGHTGCTLSFCYESAYDGFMGWISNLSSALPFMVAAGNHESECHSPACLLNLTDLGMKLNNFTAYNARWAMPSPESGGVLNMWYSYRVGPVHVTVINTETDFQGAPEGTHGDSGLLPAGGFAPNGTYMAWLQADLAAAASDPSVKWVIAGGHRPFEDFDNAFEVGELFKQYGVAAYFAGHTHSYLRFDASAYGDGTVHVTAGGSGNEEMPYPSDQHVPYEAMDEHQPGVTGKVACEAWCNRPEVREGFAHAPGATEPSAKEDPCRYCAPSPVYVSDNMALGVLTADQSSLTWQLLRAPDGLVLDTFTLTK